MLQCLDIRHFALIESATLHFGPGLNIITGETGAGKSILLGALGLVMGNRAEGVTVAEEKCVIEAHFDLNPASFSAQFEALGLVFEPLTILRREIWPNGKSRAFVNDSPVSLQQLRDLTQSLLDIHAQHEHLLLRAQDFRLEVLDVLAENQAYLAEYATLFGSWKSLAKELETLQQTRLQAVREKDFMAFQLSEWANLAWKEGDLAHLEQQQKTLGHAEQIQQALMSVLERLDGEDDGGLIQMRRMSQTLEKISGWVPGIEKEKDRLASIWIELRDIQAELQGWLSQTEVDPRALAEIDEKLNAWYQFCRKHQIQTEEEAFSLVKSWEESMASDQHNEERILWLTQEVTRLSDAAQAKANQLTENRKRAAQKLTADVLLMLAQLGMQGARLDVQLATAEQLGPQGQDKVGFLFSANPGMPMGEISKTASGGEVSRFMLCLKRLVAHKKLFPTLLFDEVDTGVSGPVADKMGEILALMSENAQIIVISHLPQVAAKGHQHFVVKKEFNQNKSFTRILKLEETGRIQEIARLLSGETITASAIENAKTLLGIQIN